MKLCMLFIGKRSSGVGMADSLMPRAVASIFVPRVPEGLQTDLFPWSKSCCSPVRLTRASNEASPKLRLKFVSKSMFFL